MKQKGQKDWREGEGQTVELVVIEQERIRELKNREQGNG